MKTIPWTRQPDPRECYADSHYYYRDMLDIANIAKRLTKEDPFIELFRGEIAIDELELQELIERKQDQM